MLIRAQRWGFPQTQRVVLAAVTAALTSLILVPAASGHAMSPDCQALPGQAPDVIVGSLPNVTKWGCLNQSGAGCSGTNAGDITAFSVGTTSCNIGGCFLNWVTSGANANDHPTIGQNMYRLKSGRFEQIGQSWLKHGFTALQGTVCGTCARPSGSGSYLGVVCSDPYDSNLNGSQSRLGAKSVVDASTGDFPASPDSSTGNVIYKRLQVHNEDLNPGQNAGALYYVDGQYVAWDDAAAKNNKNNVSYRTATVSGTAGSGVYTIALTGSTVQQKAGIEVWPVVDPTVVLVDAAVPDGKVLVAAKVTQLSATSWHYEYAVYNQTSQRAIGSFSVPTAGAASVSNLGFHDVDYHSLETIVGTDWTPTILPSAVQWATDAYTPANANTANALRWGTLYNFRFDANSPPRTGPVTLGLWRPGLPASVIVNTLVPTLCNSNGICEVGETCASCAADCANQGGGTGCCGNLTCEVGENPCRCTVDCGTQTATETACGNNIDDDCDGLIDCADSNCCQSGACSSSDGDHDGYSAVCDCNNADASIYPGAPQICDGKNNNCSDPTWPTVPASEADADGDGVRVCGNDCDDANPQVSATPGEARNLMLSYDIPSQTALLYWDPPASPGGPGVHYDTIRSDDSADFMNPAVCIETDGVDTTSTDTAAPVPSCSSYLVRARNACPNGMGGLGFESNGTPRTGRTCP